MTRTFRLFFGLTVSLSFCLTIFAQDISREALRDKIQAKRAELADLEKQFLEPTAADRTQFATLLAQPNTGLIRLLPRENYDAAVVQNNAKTLTTRGGGAYYSFKRLTHEYGYGSDVELASNHLSVGGFGGYSYGLMLKLGDIGLEDLTSQLPAVRTVLEYNPARTEAEARLEHRKFGTGADVQGFMFKSRLPLEINTTYVLRSLNYPDSDIVVGLRVVRKDTDDSIIVAFKVIKDFSVPKTASK
ncbi:MAG TPA: hypothetical protein VF251_13800 [Pyrinomonadaceae bacterium]